MCENESSSGPRMNTPSLALKIDYNLNKTAGLFRGNALHCQEKKLEDTALGFLHLYELEWNSRISSRALDSLHTSKQNKVVLLPLTSDLEKLNEYQLS